MERTDRQKMCWNCDADVSVEAAYCPFCGTDLMVGVDPEEEEESKESLHDSLASLYKPPYSVREGQGIGVSTEMAKPVRETDLSEFLVEEKSDPTARLGYGWPLVFLSIGGFMLTFGLLLLFLSSGGKLVLEFNARLWFVYAISSVPLLFLGYRLLNRGRTEGKAPSESPEHASFRT